MVINRIITVLLLLLTSIGYAQLADFNFDAVATNETCAGNGSIQMTVSNTTPGSGITYKLFLAPDYTNAVAETTTNLFGSRQAGNYRVVAIQSFNGISNSKQKDVVIQDLVVDLDYDISYSTATDCDITATLKVNILSGNPVSYEIIAGPVIVPPQPSNEFTGLPTGTYIVRVFDNCNDALSKTFTMFLQTNNLNIEAATLPVIFDSCSSAQATNVVTPMAGTQILYPLTVTYTLHPPDGSPDQVITQIIPSGPPTNLELVNTIPLYGNDIYTFDLSIEDSCGNKFSALNTVNPNPMIGLELRDAPCSTYYISLSINGYFPPFTIHFDDAPADFIPTAFNPLYPGPISDPTIDFGDDEHAVPFGNYKATVTDACGRTGSIELLVEETELEPEVGTGVTPCNANGGLIRVAIPDDRDVISAIITAGPVSPLPFDATSFVDEDGVLIVTGLPAGDYTLVVIDDCGYDYTIEETVPDFEIKGLSIAALPNCDQGSGSVKVSSGNGDLVSLSITQAPLTYMEPIPQDVTFNINADTGAMFMGNLPAGEYTFKGIDECGFELEKSAQVMGYNESDSYTLTRNCGSFNVGVFDYDTSVTNQTYWFQRFFPNTNSWGHPYTGVSYTEGAMPTTVNAIPLQNLDMVYNLFLLGDFRIIKVFESYNSGSGNINCIDVYATFTISQKLIINNAYSLDCNGGSGPSDIILDVVGVPPFNYNITSPFTFNNGSNNTFISLAPGVYTFEVTDGCGNKENLIAEVGNLLPLARANMPQSMLVCRNDTNQVGVFMLSNQDAQILGNQNPNDYKVTYHINQGDADTGNNPLDEAYTNISNPQTIYVRVTHKTLGICYATTSFPIFIGNRPILTPTLPITVCAGTTRTLVADPGFDAYEWSTGATTPSIVVTEPGTYSVTVKNVYQDFTCDNNKEYTVIGSSIAAFIDINTLDWSEGNNTVTVLVSGSGDYVYSLDNIHYQPENTFTGLMPGHYTVYVKDEHGCGIVWDEFSLLNFPNFFTPNGDGYNDTWHVKFSSFEPNMKIDIFDRYGKFIIQLFGGGPGWDGTYNGILLPSTDYWFVVTREDGSTHRGHFAMKR